MNQLNYHPSVRQLRQFSVCAAFVFVVIGWSWLASQPMTLAAYVTAASAFVVITWTFPRIVKPLFIASQIVTRPIGWVIGEIALLFVYAFVIVPLGAYFRIVGKSILNKSSSTHSASSYWKVKDNSRSVASYYRQF